MSCLNLSVSVAYSLIDCEQKLTSPKKLLTPVAFAGDFALFAASTLDWSG